MIRKKREMGGTMRYFPEGLIAEYTDSLGTEHIRFSSASIAFRGAQLEWECLDALLTQLPQDGTLNFQMPLPFLRLTGQQESLILEIQAWPDPQGQERHFYQARCRVDEQIYQSPPLQGGNELEDALTALCEQLSSVGHLQACIYCQFSKIEAYGGSNGNGVSGHLYCFVGAKETYLRFSTPEDITQIKPYHRSKVYTIWPVPPVDEFHGCGEFVLRPLKTEPANGLKAPGCS